MNNLRLKSEVKINNQDIVIYKRLGGKNVRCKFPINTPQSEYINYYNQGFRIFRCDECGSDTCNGNHIEDLMEDVEVYTPSNIEGDVEELMDELKLSNINNHSKSELSNMTLGEYIESETNLEDTKVDLIRVSGDTTTEFSVTLSEQSDEELIQMIDDLGIEMDYVNDYVREDYVNLILDEYNKQGESPQTKPDYQGMKLKELRKMFPDIKATSKDDFISQIK